MSYKWYEKNLRRSLIDTHIVDWDDRFLTLFDPQIYVDMLSKAQVKTAMVYANSHVGHCYWPTKNGHMHKGLKGRDILGEVIKLCHQRGMDVIIYYTLIFVNWAYENFPEWRMVNPQGEYAHGLGSPRYGVCCPNTSYRDWAVEQLEEICKNYEFEGVWPDMTFWPDVCYCSSCQKRYMDEVGEDLPRIVNWEDPKWVTFQRKREEWLAEFGHLVTSTIKKYKPDATVAHQSNGFLWDWIMGASVDLAEANDFMSADLYGDIMQQSFGCKLFYNLSNVLPFEYMTSRCPDLHHHTTMKSKELLENQAYATLANDGGFIFLDAIDPLGTLNENVYSEMGEILKQLKPYEKFVGGKLCQDVGIYINFESRIYLEDNEKPITEVITNWGYEHITGNKLTLHSSEAISFAKTLINNHIPYGVITKKNISDLSSYKIIILPNVIMIDSEEIEAFKDFVASGGTLLVTKYSSLLDKEGHNNRNFLLSDLLGVSYVGETDEIVTYMAPTDNGKEILTPHSIKYPLELHNTQVKVRAEKGTKILATLTLPYTDPKDPSRFASIHSNPPGIHTEYPSITMNEFGKGKVLYIAANPELHNHEETFIRLLGSISSQPFSLEANAPKAVEITLFHQEQNKRFLINFLNFQKELPNIPVDGIVTKLRINGKKPVKLQKLPENKELAFKLDGDYIVFNVPKLETFMMMALDYE